MGEGSVKVGIVGLGRWAKVLTRAIKPSDKIQIVRGFSRSQEKRESFAREMGVPAAADLQSMLQDPQIKGVILTVPNEQHLPVAREVAEVGSIASKLSPVGAEVDDQSMTVMKFADGKIGYVGSSWTSPGIFAVRVFGSKGLMHYEIDFGTWDTPDKLHKNSTLYIQRGKDGWSKREELAVPESDMFRVELVDREL